MLQLTFCMCFASIIPESSGTFRKYSGWYQGDVHDLLFFRSSRIKFLFLCNFVDAWKAFLPYFFSFVNRKRFRRQNKDWMERWSLQLLTPWISWLEGAYSLFICHCQMIRNIVKKLSRPCWIRMPSLVDTWLQLWKGIRRVYHNAKGSF